MTERFASVGMEPEAAGSTWQVLSEMHRTKVIYYLPLLLFAMTGAAIMNPFLPNITTNFFASQRLGHAVECEKFAVGTAPEECVSAHGDAAMWQGASSFVSSSVMTFLFSPVLGAASDRYGRKPFILLGTVASCLPALVLVLYYNLNLISLYWYYPVHAAIGAFSSTSLTLAAVSDSMPKQNRAAAFGIVISFAYIGFIVGPLLGRVVTTADDALYLSLMLVVLCAVYVLVVLEETLPCKASPQQTDGTLEAPLLLSVEPAEVSVEDGAPPPPLSLCASITSISILARTPLFRRLTVLVMFYALVEGGIQSTIFQYLQVTLNFQKNDLAALLLVIGLNGLLVQMVLLGPLMRLLGERWLIAFGLVVQIVENVAIALAFSKIEVFAAISLGALAMVTFPAISALKANNVGAGEQGQIQGALVGAQSLAAGVGPMMFSFVFKLFSSENSPHGLPYFPSAPFLVGSAMLLVALGVAVELCLMDRCGGGVRADQAPAEAGDDDEDCAVGSAQSSSHAA